MFAVIYGRGNVRLEMYQLGISVVGELSTYQEISCKSPVELPTYIINLLLGEAETGSLQAYKMESFATIVSN